jgi:hypothetical protein
MLLLAAGPLGEAPERVVLAREWIERWHDFYLMAGTAAVTLAGLLFVALSLHLDRFVEKSHEHLLALSRVTLLSFTFVLFASLFMLVPVPAQGVRQTAIMVAAVGVAGLSWTIGLMRAAQHHDEAGFTRAQMRRRLIIPVVGYFMMLVTALGLWFGIGEILFMMIGAVCMILGNAAGTSWELLVQIAKQKRVR